MGCGEEVWMQKSKRLLNGGVGSSIQLGGLWHRVGIQHPILVTHCSNIAM